MASTVYKILFIFALLDISQGKYVEGELKTDSSKLKDVWRFIARFCFVSGGEFKFKLEYPERYEVQSINLYYDDPDKWAEVYHSKKDCEKRTTLPYINVSAGHQISLQQSNVDCQLDDDTVKCDSKRTFRSARQRWWYMVLSRCEPDRVRNDVKGMKLKYELTMTNGDGLFFRHFSADEFYILQIDITFLLITFVLLCVTFAFTVKLIKKKLLHTTFKMYVAALIFHFMYLFFMCINYGAYANDGIERFGLKAFARLFEVLFDLTFILMLILMGKGYTITRGKLRKATWIKIIVFMFFYILAYIILFLVEAATYDAADVLYVYASPPGYGLVILRVISWVWFLYGNIFTLKHYPEKRKFYIPFLIFFTVWFLATPIIVLVAAYAMADWVRATVVNAIEVFIALAGQIFFLILTAPSSANKNFPYHVKANKIGFLAQAPHHDPDHSPISDDEDEDEPSNSARPLDLPRYSRDDPIASAPYSTQNGAPNFMDLFTTSQTHSTNPRSSMPFSPPPMYTVSQRVAENQGFEMDSPPPYSNGQASEEDKESHRRFSNHENPFITQR